MAQRPIRLGVSLFRQLTPADTAEAVCAAKSAGFDMVLVVDADCAPTPSVGSGEAIRAASYELMSMAAGPRTVVGITTLGNEAELAKRVEYAKNQLGEMYEAVELGFAFLHVSLGELTDSSKTHKPAPSDSNWARGELANHLGGSVPQAAERILRMHQCLGISYFTLHKSNSTSWRTLARLVRAVK